ncbi:sugar-binding domain-containing protein [Paenibacillus pinistramenti]|uniref:sugar-binding domain-containing protein n=1 Tax=Paenibacillus pinistramenti TaxID=1768003 RepID=UPI001109AA1B|nr:sugar-binding domain-containing protein [Paenibacillus pinistramenti]
MLHKMSLEGSWRLQLDEQKEGLKQPYQDSIELPGTTSHAQKGQKNEKIEIDALTDEYAFEGFAWFAKEIVIPEEFGGKTAVLFLERTRVTTVWIDGQEIGTQSSLNTPHRYLLQEGLTAGRHEITVRVDNTNYPTKGGHLTSKDTQTNWNGITGRLELQFYGDACLENIRVTPDVAARTFKIEGHISGQTEGVNVIVSAASLNRGEGSGHKAAPQTFKPASGGAAAFEYELGDGALLWSDSEPNLYTLTLTLQGAGDEVLDRQELIAGLREFKADGDKFAINGVKTFLRGKHDGLIFPLTGYAPTDVEEWVRIMSIAKSYGINHYRFHTCCPPEAAFTAADLLGIFMESELPFWGTITDETYENHNQAEQDYLISEGYAMLKEFGNHPSFVMMSLGNELWGSKTRIDGILRDYKQFDDRPMYTQGSNNFQWVPEILEHEDFFSGVRFDRDRLFRGSYAMCDAPQGHVQVDRPSTLKDYDEAIVPPQRQEDGKEEAGAGIGGTISIQYGTGTKEVEAEAVTEQLIPHVPVVSHEIGQYATFPNFEEIGKYKGSLKAKNFEVFRERLEAKGLGHLAQKYFENSGRLAAASYKEELEAAFRSRRLAGFQILDLQDFSGQGTALVGILDAFMDSKGLVTPEEWRTYCSDAVLLGRFAKYNYEAGEAFSAQVELSNYRPQLPAGLTLHWELSDGQAVLASGEMAVPASQAGDYVEIGEIQTDMPAVDRMTKAALKLAISGTDIWKTYDLWIYPQNVEPNLSGLHLFSSLTDEAAALLEQGEDVLLLAHPDQVSHAVEGTYCTDFWCYPMFRSISESMNKPVPIGTMGLLIDSQHPVFGDFAAEEHSTYPWWEIVMHSKSFILDELPQNLQPIVQTIDNFERNHKLGLLFEARVRKGRLLMGAVDIHAIKATLEGRQLLSSIANYMNSDKFNPQAEISFEELRSLLR